MTANLWFLRIFTKMRQALKSVIHSTTVSNTRLEIFKKSINRKSAESRILRSPESRTLTPLMSSTSADVTPLLHVPVLLDSCLELIKLQQKNILFEKASALRKLTRPSVSSPSSPSVSPSSSPSLPSSNRKPLFVDATFGYGGYSTGILNTIANSTVIAIDQDPIAYQRACHLRDTKYKDRLFPVLAEFGKVNQIVTEFIQMNPRGTFKGDGVEGILFDVGVSSMQLDQAHRGFSFSKDGPLDMRMDSSRDINAYTIVNQFPAPLLREILFKYGQEQKAKKIVEWIEKRRQSGPIQSTMELADIIVDAIGYTKKKKNLKRTSTTSSLHPATKTFQALRIYINQELHQLYRGLEGSVQLVNPGGLVLVVSFHSLEDRLVKRFFTGEGSKYGEKDFLQWGVENGGEESFIVDRLIEPTPFKYRKMRWDAYNQEMMRQEKENSIDNQDDDDHIDTEVNQDDSPISSTNENVTEKYRMITRKVVLPTEEEVESNPRSRSAKLRPYIRIE